MGTTGDKGGHRGQETQERSAQGFCAESTLQTFPASEERLADVKEPTQFQSLENNENNDLERVKSFFEEVLILGLRGSLAVTVLFAHPFAHFISFLQASKSCRNSINSVNENALSVTWASPADRTDQPWLNESEPAEPSCAAVAGRGSGVLSRFHHAGECTAPHLRFTNPGEEFYHNSTISHPRVLICSYLRWLL